MRYPIDGTITITGAFREVAQPGTGLPDAYRIKRHIGVDFRASIGTPVKAPGSGVVTQSYTSATSGLQVIEIRIADKLWRFLHLSRRDVVAGAKVTEGQVIGLSGNSGGVLAHLHVDARKDGTAWNASLENYVNPLDLITGGSSQGGAMVTDKAQLDRLYLAVLHRARGAGEGEDVYLGKDSGFVFDDLYKSTERANKLSAEQTQLANLQVAANAPHGSSATPDQVLGGNLVANLRQVVKG